MRRAGATPTRTCGAGERPRAASWRSREGCPGSESLSLRQLEKRKFEEVASRCEICRSAKQNMIRADLFLGFLAAWGVCGRAAH